MSLLAVWLLPAAAAATLPTFTTNQSASFVVGQPDFVSDQGNQGASASATTLELSYGVFSDGTRLYVTDNGNNRVLIYSSTPTVDGSSATVAVGQPDLVSSSANQGLPQPGAGTLNLEEPGSSCYDGTNLYVADSGNNRVLVYSGPPSSNGASAEYVLGQPDMASDNINQGMDGPTAYTLNDPEAVYCDGARVYVADTGNNRVLIFNSIPSTNTVSADVVLGQPDFFSDGSNQYSATASTTLASPTSVWSDGTRLYVVDNQNNRVLVFNSIPSSNDPAADFALGQPDTASSGPNQNGPAAANTLSDPYGVYSDGNNVYVADYGNNRVLVYPVSSLGTDESASVALGQPDMGSTQANQGAAGPSSNTLAGPSAVASDGSDLYVVDNANSRVLEFGILPPTGLAAAAQGVSSITWTWNSVAGATGYDFFPSTGGAPIALTGNAATSLTLTGLSTNTFYGGQVAATQSSGMGGPTSEVSAYTLAAPATGLAVVSVGSSTLSLAWSPNGNPAGTIFEAEVSADPTFSTGVSSQSLAGLTTGFAGLAPATTYYAQVLALNGNGIPTASTSAVTAATLAPSAPSGVSGAGQTTSSILWSWTAVPGATSYNVFEATNTASLVGTSPMASFLDTGLSTNTAYGVVVQAAGQNGGGALSPAATAYTLAAAPSGLAAAPVGYSSATLSWSADGNPAGTVYLIQISSAAGFGAPTTTQTLTGLTTTFLGLASGTVYTAEALAQNGDGLLTAGATIAVVTNAVAPSAPQLGGICVSSQAVLWQWTAPGGLAQASSFDLWSSTSGLLAQLPAGATSFLETGLTAGTTESAYLVAVNTAGSAFSSTAAVVPAALGAYGAGAGSPATITDPLTGLTGLSISAGALSQPGTWLMSDDPVGSPLISASPQLIAQANAQLSGVAGSASSLREFVVSVGGVRYTGGFSAPVTVSVPYPDPGDTGVVEGTKVRASALQLYVLNEQTGAWTALPGSSVDTVNKVVTAQAPHLSVFTAMGPTDAADQNLSSVRVYPNPWRPGSGGVQDAAAVVFDGLTSEATIRLFTISGRLVRELDKPASTATAQQLWDGNDSTGHAVASGVYYYVVTAPGGLKATGRVAVIR